jgi:hypothetical protein
VDVVDDFEDNNNGILETDGRRGFWYAYNDGTGSQQPQPGQSMNPTNDPIGQQGMVGWTMGEGFELWGAGFGFDLNVNQDGGRSTWDASASNGIQFKVRGTGLVRFIIPSTGTTPVEDGGTCVPVGEDKCNDHYGAPIQLTEEWKTHTLRFSQLYQRGWGVPCDFTTDELFAVLWNSSGTADFEMWVDDVGFWNVETLEGATYDAVDDLEDGDRYILTEDGRIGSWYTYNDNSTGGWQTPATDEPFVPSVGGHSESSFSAYTEAEGYATWGAGFGFDLATPPTLPGEKAPEDKGLYDANQYDGLHLLVQGSGTVMLSLVQHNILDPANGGTCDETRGDCNDHYKVAIDLPDQWSGITLPFANFEQSGWGIPESLDLSSLVAIQVQSEANETLNVAVDEVKFYALP